GIQSVVDVLNEVDRSTERTILDTLEIQDPDLAEEIKKRMFIFDDIVILDNRALQRIIRDVEADDLRLSLRVASDEVKDVIFKYMSQRLGETFIEVIVYVGPVILRVVSDAKTRLVDQIPGTEVMDDICISRCVVI